MMNYLRHTPFIIRGGTRKEGIIERSNSIHQF